MDFYVFLLVHITSLMYFICRSICWYVGDDYEKGKLGWPHAHGINFFISYLHTILRIRSRHISGLITDSTCVFGVVDEPLASCVWWSTWSTWSTLVYCFWAVVGHSWTEWRGIISWFLLFYSCLYTFPEFYLLCSLSNGFILIFIFCKLNTLCCQIPWT